MNNDIEINVKRVSGAWMVIHDDQMVTHENLSEAMRIFSECYIEPLKLNIEDFCPV